MKRIVWWWLLAVPVQAGAHDATVQFAHRLELGVPVSGVVREVNAVPGERAARGQALVRLDEAPFRAAVGQAEAEVARVQTLRTEAVRDYRQAQELYDRTVLSAVELENAKLRQDRAEATLKEAQARLAQARWALAQSAIVAPFDAWVLDVRTVAGSAVVTSLESRVLVVLARQGEYVARTRVPGPVLAALQVGQAAKVTVAGKDYPGRVASLALEPVGAKTDGVYEVAVAFSAAARLPAGQAASVEFP